jgi:hypothetical protein
MTATVANCLFFGCHDQPGHFLWSPGWRRAWGHPRWGDGWMFDGGYAPRRSENGKLFHMTAITEQRDQWRAKNCSSECPQGQFFLHVPPTFQRPCWTIMSWWDRCQGDKRGACNSTVLMEGEHTAQEMIQALREHFPSVLDNLAKAGVELVPVQS